METGEKRDRLGRRRTPAERRAELLAAYRQSGLTQTAFARREGIRYSTFCTWAQVLSTIEPDSMVVIAPEGRMKRATGLDLQGNPMTVRGGVADILRALKQGRMLIAYSGGLHHVQVPGHIPNVFETVRLRGEVLEIADYNAEMLKEGGEEQFKRNVIKDLERRRGLHCPEDPPAQAAPTPPPPSAG